MSQINLLPWRTLRKQQQQRRFLVILGAVSLLMLGLIWVMNHWVLHQTALQRQDNQTLTQQVTVLQQQLQSSNTAGLERQQLVTRMELIAHYQQQRNLSVWLFNHLAELVPDDVSLQQVELVEQRLQLNGYTRHASALATMLRQLEQTPAIEQARLHSLVNKPAPEQEQGTVAQFSLQVAINTEVTLPQQVQP